LFPVRRLWRAAIKRRGVLLDRSELTFAIATALVGAVLLGWILRWLFGRMNATGPRNAARTANLVSRLHAAEEAQFRAETRLAEVEADASQRLADLQAELDATLASLARAEAQTEEIRDAYRRALIDRGTGTA
jgi:hypothetical protein